MSFGFSIGDVIRVFELARDTYHDCRHAPTQFRDAGRGADGLRAVLESIHAEMGNQNSVLHQNERTATEFAMCAKRCESELLRLRDIVTRYKSLGTANPKVVDRFRFPKKDLIDIRGKLLYHTATLTAFLNTIGIGVQGRLEGSVRKSLGLQGQAVAMQQRSIDLQKESKDLQNASMVIQKETLQKQDQSLAIQHRILDAIDRYAAEARVGGTAGSVLSDHSNDEKNVWKGLRSRLISEGVKSRFITENESVIVERIRELIDFNMFDSEAETEYTPSLVTRSELAWDGDDDDDEWDFVTKGKEPAQPDPGPDDGDSEATVTPKGTVADLRALTTGSARTPPGHERDTPSDADSEGTVSARLARKLSKKTEEADRRLPDQERAKPNPLVPALGAERSDTTSQPVTKEHSSSVANLITAAATVSDVDSDSDLSDETGITSMTSDRRSTIYSIQRPGPDVRAQLLSSKNTSGPLRVWRGLNGFHLKGRHRGRRGEFVVLEDESGEEVLVSYTNLIQEDKDHLEAKDEPNELSPNGPDPDESDTTLHQEHDSDGGTQPVGLALPLRQRNRFGKRELVGKRTRTRVVWQYRSPLWVPPTGPYMDPGAARALPGAAGKGDLELVKRLLKTSDYARSDSRHPDTADKADALKRAVKGGHFEVAKCLLESNADVRVSSFSEAILSYPIYQEDEPMVRLLLEYGADPEGRDRFFSQFDAILAVSEKDKDDSARSPPLYLAAKAGLRNIVRLLLDYDAEINVLGPESKTPLYIATRHGHRETVELLLEEGAYTGALTANGQSALLAAVAEDDFRVTRLLLDYRADPNTRDSSSGRTALFIASDHGQTGIVRLLLRYGADPDMPNKPSRTMFGLAGSTEPNRGRRRRKSAVQATRPLEIAAQGGRKEIVEMLLNASAEVQCSGIEATQPVNLAAANGHAEIVALLEAHGAVLATPRIDRSTSRGRSPWESPRRRPSSVGSQRTARTNRTARTDRSSRADSSSRAPRRRARRPRAVEATRKPSGTFRTLHSAATRAIFLAAAMQMFSRRNDAGPRKRRSEREMARNGRETPDWFKPVEGKRGEGRERGKEGEWRER